MGPGDSARARALLLLGPGLWFVVLALGGCEAVLGLGNLRGAEGGGGTTASVSSGSSGGAGGGGGTTASISSSSSGGTGGGCPGEMCNGACVDTTQDSENCGTCGTVCTDGTTCMSGMCACTVEQTMCPTVGCVDLSTDPSNCGGCGQPCVLPNAVPACKLGQCTVASCSAGFRNCDGNATNGCETNTQTNADNCGACGTVCTVANGVADCTSGMCGAASCTAGFTDCDNNPTNGCEVKTSNDPENCGTCSHVCSVPGADTSCTNGTCILGFCNAGFKNCNNQASDGCEVNTQTDPNNCGACGNVCSFANAVAGCTNGMCTCVAGACGPSGSTCTTNTQCMSGKCCVTATSFAACTAGTVGRCL
jgi:hypothetical protein